MKAVINQSLKRKATEARESIESMVRISEREEVDCESLKFALAAIKTYLVDLKHGGASSGQYSTVDEYTDPSTSPAD